MVDHKFLFLSGPFCLSPSHLILDRIYLISHFSFNFINCFLLLFLYFVFSILQFVRHFIIQDPFFLLNFSLYLLCLFLMDFMLSVYLFSCSLDFPLFFLYSLFFILATFAWFILHFSTHVNPGSLKQTTIGTCVLQLSFVFSLQFQCFVFLYR